MKNSYSLDQIKKTGDPNADLLMRQNKFDKIAIFKEIKSKTLN